MRNMTNSILLKRITLLTRLSYIKMKDIDLIRQQNKGSSTIGVIPKIGSFYMKQSWHDFKGDYILFKELRVKQKLNTQQKQLLRRIRSDMIKFIPALIIFNVPFGFPLFYLYVKLFPRLIPSWMMLDTIYQKLQQSRQQRRIQSYVHYKQSLDKNVLEAYLREAISKENPRLDDWRRIAVIAYGDYVDGTQYLTTKIGYQFPNGFFVPRVSLFLLRIFLRKQVQLDFKLQSELTNIQSFQDKLFNKLTQEITKLQYIYSSKQNNKN